MANPVFNSSQSDPQHPEQMSATPSRLEVERRSVIDDHDSTTPQFRVKIGEV